MTPDPFAPARLGPVTLRNRFVKVGTAACLGLWLVTGVVFGSMSFVGAAPTQHAAHALGHAHVLSMASTHG